jgi:hypothetical protein
MLISSLVVLMVLTELKLQDSSRGYMHGGSGKEGGGGGTAEGRLHSSHTQPQPTRAEVEASINNTYG